MGELAAGCDAADMGCNSGAPDQGKSEGCGDRRGIHRTAHLGNKSLQNDGRNAWDVFNGATSAAAGSHFSAYLSFNLSVSGDSQGTSKAVRGKTFGRCPV
jgi:hypothetical protein